MYFFGRFLGVELAIEVEQHLARRLLAFGEKAAAQSQHFRGRQRGSFVTAGGGWSGRRHAMRFRPPVEVLPDARPQRAGVDGLGYIAVAARLDGFLFVALHSEGRKRHHSDVAGLLVFLNTAGELEAIDAWQLDVRQDQLRMIAAE